MFQIFATTPETMGPGQIGAHAGRAEAIGFDGLQVPDAVHDGLLLSVMALHASERLIVGTGVLVAFPRSPMTVAVAAQWEKQRAMLGFLYSTPAYWPSLELFGWQDKGQQLQTLTRENRWQDMSEIVTDKMLERFVPRGTYDDIADVLRERYAGLTSRITFPMPEDPADDVLAAAAIARLRAG